VKKLLLKEKRIASTEIDCTFCDQKNFKTTDALKSHIGTAHKSYIQHQWFPCSVCDIHLPDKHELKKHELIKHQVISGSDRVVLPSPGNVLSTFDGVEGKPINKIREMPSRAKNPIEIEEKEYLVEVTPDFPDSMEIKHEQIEHFVEIKVEPSDFETSVKVEWPNETLIRSSQVLNRN